MFGVLQYFFLHFAVVKKKIECVPVESHGCKYDTAGAYF
jgi:hypothetical protein